MMLYSVNAKYYLSGEENPLCVHFSFHYFHVDSLSGCSTLEKQTLKLITFITALQTVHCDYTSTFQKFLPKDGALLLKVIKGSAHRY